MRALWLTGWLMVPVAVGAYHYGPGQERLKADDAGVALQAATAQAESERWAEAVTAYDRALGALPAGHEAEARAIRLERAKAQMFAGQLPEARFELAALVDEAQADPKADPALLAGARESLANSQYYMTWLMRLEGLPREEWEPEIDASRQGYRLLAERAAAQGDDEAADRLGEDLESAIRLARMEPGDLQGMALPKQCQGCKSGQCKGKKPVRKPGGGEKVKDARGASSGPPPDGAGS